MLLFLILCAVVAGQVLLRRAEHRRDKIALRRPLRGVLIVADLLFLVTLIHVPHDDAGRAWGLWLSLVCVLAINVGLLLVTTHAGEWVVEHWPHRRRTATVAAPPPTSFPPGSVHGGESNGGSHIADYRPTPMATPPGPEHRPNSASGNPADGGWPAEPPRSEGR